MNKLSTIKRKSASRRGFTLAETLLVIGVLVILMALLIPNLVQRRRDLRQKELDTKAELIYVAAQNELAKLRAGGNAATYNLSAGGGATVGKFIDGDGKEMTVLFCLSDSASRSWMDGAADELLLGNQWIIVYSKESASVQEVFYCETTELNQTTYQTWRLSNRENLPRNQLGLVGWYGGDVVSSGVTYKTITPVIDVDDGERLTLTFRCDDAPAGVTLKYELTIEDAMGRTVVLKDTDFVDHNTLVLDAVDNRFIDNTKFRTNTNQHLYPGVLKLTLTAEAANIDCEPYKITVNSLYGQKSENDGKWTTNAWIECGRHLQNLDKSALENDGLNTPLDHRPKTAVQKDDIHFGEGSKWAACYTKNGAIRTFEPITNLDLTSYDGGNKLIDGINAKGSYNSGLFAEIAAAMTLKNIYLTNASAYCTQTANANAGMLVGKVSANCTIQNCAVYFQTQRDAQAVAKDTTGPKYLIRGTSAGGLVGSVTSGTLTIKESFAATTVGSHYVGTALSTEAAGGLVGSVGSGATVTIRKSYADCYLSAKSGPGGSAGGLVGSNSGSVDIQYCYAAGFVFTPANTAAGLVNTLTEGTEDIKKSYSVLDLNDSSGAKKQDCRYYTAAGVEGSIGSMTRQELKNALGNENVWNTSTPATLYNLDGNGRDNKSFSYPGVSGLEHYGDWDVGFQPGALVYYEVFKDGNKEVCGFSGAGISSTLYKGDGLPLIGDGYAIVFKRNTVTGATVKVYDGDSTVPRATQTISDMTFGTYSASIGGTTTNNSKVYTVSIGDGVYYVYPLDKSIVNAAPTGFWSRAEIEFSLAGDKKLTYWFNPLMADTKQRDDGETPQQPALPQAINVRSPRQFNALAEYYSAVWNTLVCSFTQERALNYCTTGTTVGYDWQNFSTKANSWDYSQPPIGWESAPFNCAYNGSCLQITGVNVNGVYDEDNHKSYSSVGLFGKTTGWLENIVLVAHNDGASDGGSVRRGNLLAGESGYIGTLVGHNAGTLSNCAVAGYRLTAPGGTLYTYENSTLYLGGLVGRNDGNITRCSVVFSEISVNALYSNISMGGLVGRNGKSVQDSYAIGHMVADAKESTVNVAGFAGANTGSVSGSYCVVSTVTSGAAKSYAFAPGGTVRSSYFLNNGTYYYLGTLHAFSTETSENGAVGKNFEQLMALSGSEWARRSLYDDWSEENAYSNDSKDYPFRAVVTGPAGLVHYGNWPIAPILGDYGVFYWEHEADGTNNGYHFSFLGAKDESGVETLTRGSTLCTSHDDGGVIVAYGYGYYYTNGHPATPEWDAALKKNQSTAADSISKTAAVELEKQMNGYTFVPYVTGYGTGDTDYLYLEGDVTAANLKLTVGSHFKTYTISPFFADALSRVENDNWDEDHQNEWVTPGDGGNPFEIRSVEQLQFINWNRNTHSCSELVKYDETATDDPVKTNYKMFPYLQYATTFDTGEAKESKTATENARPPKTWTQTHDLNGVHTENGTVVSLSNYTPIAGKATSSGAADHAAPLYAWFGGTYMGNSYKIQDLTIISDSFTVGLFGVTVGANISDIILYGSGAEESDGVPYARIIRQTLDSGGQVNRKVGAYQIGGMIALAYDYDVSNTKNTITNCAVAGYQIIDNSHNQQGLGYAGVGGLIGITQVKLQKCSAVVDIELNYRSPLDLAADPWPGRTTQKPPRDNKVYTWYGNMIRAGGLAGTALGSISDCYTGGSITVDDGNSSEGFQDTNSTLYELPYQMQLNPNVKTGLDFNQALHIFIGGIAGSVYKNGIVNFGATNSATDGAVTIERCYTYMDLPSMEGNVRAVSVIAGIADRFHRGSKITATKCYYLQSVFDNITYTPPGYFFDLQAKTNSDARYAFIDNTRYSFTLKDSEPHAVVGANDDLRDSYRTGDYAVENDVTDIKLGNLDSLCMILNNQSQGWKKGLVPSPEQQTGKTYNELIGLTSTDLSADWGPVTVTEVSDGITNEIHGKYSFSDEPSQKGQDYPFPTIIRQKDPDHNRNVNVHYGAWPFDGAHWAVGRDSMDIFAVLNDQEKAGNTSTWADKKLTLYLKDTTGVDTVDFTAPTSVDTETNKATYTAGELTITLFPADTAILTRVQKESDSVVSVTLRAVDVGPVTLTAVKGTEKASCSVSITADLTIGANTSEIMLTNGQAEVEGIATAVKVPAASGTDNAGNYSAKGTWSVTPETDKAGKSLLSILPKDGSTDPEKKIGEGEKPTGPVTPGNPFNVSKVAPGDCFLTLTYTYNYNGKALTDTAVVSVRTMGYIGIANADVSDSFALSRLVSDTPESYTGYDTEKLSAPQGAEIFLFAPAAENDLASFVITKKEVKAGTGDFVDVTNADTDPTCPYSVDFLKDSRGGAEFATVGGFNLYGAAVRRTAAGNGEAETVTVRLTLTDPLLKDDSDVPVSYVLTVTATAYPYELRFDPNNAAATGSMHAVGVDKNSVIPNCSARFNYVGHKIAGWTVQKQPADTDTVYVTGDNVSPLFENTESVTLYAKWETVSYQVQFWPGKKAEGDPVEDAVTLTFQYGDGIPLPDPTAVNQNGEPLQDGETPMFAVPSGSVGFLSWNTRSNGFGTEYLADVAYNLTETNGATVVLYAQWKNGIRLKLYNGIDSNDDPVLYDTRKIGSNDTTLIGTVNNAYEQPSVDGWTFLGWYVETDTGRVMLFEPDGDTVHNVDGYTDADGKLIWEGVKDTNGTITDNTLELYARWSRKAYVVTRTNELKEQTDNGSYLIASNTNGGNLMKLNSAQNGVESLAATVSQAVDESGAAQECVFMDSAISNDAVWVVTRIEDDEPRDSAFVRKNAKTFTFKVLNRSKFLRHEKADKTNNLPERIAFESTPNWPNNYNEGSSYSNRKSWNYSGNVLMAQVTETLTVGYVSNSSKWELVAGNKCYLFKFANVNTTGVPQLIDFYTYDPS